jgi:hypothetical protein
MLLPARPRAVPALSSCATHPGFRLAPQVCGSPDLVGNCLRRVRWFLEDALPVAVDVSTTARPTKLVAGGEEQVPRFFAGCATLGARIGDATVDDCRHAVGVVGDAAVVGDDDRGRAT